MAAITGTFGLVGAQSLSALYTLGSASDTISNTDLLTTSGLSTKPNGGSPSALAKFLTTIFASDTAAEAAFRALGGRISCRVSKNSTAADVITIAFQNINAVPALVIAGAGAPYGQVLELTIELPHSITQ